jgi:hypothetical protein
MTTTPDDPTAALTRIADALPGGQPFPDGIDGSLANAELIDECYRRAGLSPRGCTSHDRHQPPTGI